MTRMLLDQGLSPTAAALLRSIGWNAIHVIEAGLDRSEDADILEFTQSLCNARPRLTSLWENIVYGNPRATPAKVKQAACDANIHEFIETPPESYRTQVGERGMKLSGGKRQRIALARAFLKDAPILIPDEPTSAVDVAPPEHA